MSKLPPIIICLMGPTCSGKTDLAIQLVQTLPCEIISVDSALIYREMNIGTAKPDPATLKIAPHHLIDIRDPTETYSVGQFRIDALQAIENILAQNKIPLLVGGTMLYFRALQQGIADLPSASNDIRQRLTAEIQQFGLAHSHQRLQTIDPIAAQRIHPNDPQRIQRALEVYETTGKTLTEFLQNETSNHLPYSFLNVAIAPSERNILHKHISTRFENMLKQGFIEEVEKLLQRGDLNPDLPAMRAVGYRQIWSYLAGEYNYQVMVERGIIATRQLAKRQLTWLRSWQNLTWLTSENTNNAATLSALLRRQI